MSDTDAGRMLVARAAEMLGRPPAPIGGTGVIVVDDAGDGSAAAQVAAACRRHDDRLQIVVGGGQPATSAAAVVVVVVDAGCATGPQLRDVVERHLQIVGRVALVCNKIDVYWEWPVLLAADRDRVDRARLCPLFAIAADHPDDPESGVAGLVEWLRAESRSDPERAQLTSAAATLSEVTEATDRIAQLRRRRAEVVAERDRGRADRLAALRVGLNGCRGACAARLSSRLRGVCAEALARADDVAASRDAHGIADWLAHTVEVSARAEFDELHARLARIRSVALLGLGAVRVGPDATPPRPAHRPLPKPGRGADDALVMVLGASTGLGVGRLAASPLTDIGFAGWTSTAATVVVGVAMALWVVRTRRRAALRAAMRGWVTETCADARSRIEQAMALTVNDVEAQLMAATARHYERTDRLIAQEVADIDAQLRLLARREREAVPAMSLRRDIARYLG